MAIPNLADIYAFRGYRSKPMEGVGYNTSGQEGGLEDPNMWTSYGGEQMDGNYEKWLNEKGIKYHYEMDSSGGEAGTNSGKQKLVIDWDSLPKTKFGNVGMTEPLNYRNGNQIIGRNAIDNRLVYDDPNYGRITHQANIKDKTSWADYGGQLAMALGSMGMGLIGMPAMAMAGVNAARSIGSGNWKGAALDMGMYGLGAGLGGVSPELSQIANYARRGYGLYKTGKGLSNMYRRRGG